MQHQLKKIKGISQITYKYNKTFYTILINSDTLNLESEDIFKNVSKGELNNKEELIDLFEFIKTFNLEKNLNLKFNKLILINFIKKYGYIQTPFIYKQQEFNEIKLELHKFLQLKLLKDNKFLSDFEISEIIKKYWGKFFNKNFKVMGNEIINFITQSGSIYSKINFLIIVDLKRKDFLIKNNLLFNEIENNKLIIFLDMKKFQWFRDLFNENLWEFEIKDFEVEEEIICD